MNPPHVLPDQRESRLAFVMRWQQLTGPIQAKSFEDTALYLYHPLLSTNEVGGDPRPTEAASREQFYGFLQRRLESWPASLNATETHDTKRSEDARARLNVLSEIPEEWNRHLEFWAKQNEPLKQKNGAEIVPDRNEEYFLYQTLIGMWPLDPNAEETLLTRVQEHLIKATREAMVHTRWTRPNQPHEEALKKFAADILCTQCGTEFLNDFRRFHQRLAYFGMINGLSQTLLKITSPGVVDFYQGSELWDLRLVDPDNRGPIDFVRRKAALASIASKANIPSDDWLRELAEHWQDGRIKMHLIRAALTFRRDHQDLFSAGEFVPVQAEGQHARNIIGFMRQTPDSSALVVVPRWFSKLCGPEVPPCRPKWGDTRIMLPDSAARSWNNILTRTKLDATTEAAHPVLLVSSLLSQFPVALCHPA